MSAEAEMGQFYRHHRGGSGAVILVTACHANGRDGQEHGIFSCIETAQDWSRHLGDGFVCVFSPYIVDDPDWGNEAREVNR